MRKIKEWFSIQLVKNPGNVVLVGIILFNVIFFLFAAVVISALSLDGTESLSFIEAAFCTITMILDAGCIQFVISDIGQSGVFITVFCLIVVLVGMISFTGALIGYATNYISQFIEHSNSGKRKLKLSDHFIILNWNNRAVEIINDMLFSDEKQNIVVLVQSGKEDVEKEIHERIEATERLIRHEMFDEKQSSGIAGLFRNRNKYKTNHINVIVRQGDVFSSKQLSDISIDQARAVIILGNDINNTLCRFEHKEILENAGRGNARTIKTLMQVADMTAAESSADNQKIIVEITDEWTLELVNKIIQAKQRDGKCNIIPVKVNEVLGQLLSQFCLMPELNSVYSELFSNRGVEFHSVEYEDMGEEEFIRNYLATHNHAIPITTQMDGGKPYAFFVAESDDDIHRNSSIRPSEYSVALNTSYWIERKNIIILGHNSKCKNIMAGFESFSGEWKRDEEIVRIVVVDDKANLEKMNYYKDYPFVIKTVEADIYDRDVICNAIEEFVAEHEEDTSILILSDDSALNEDIDSGALANLVYVRDIIEKKKCSDPAFNPGSMDIVVEIIDPKHHDIVSSYSVNNVVISNRYISKMITQISEYEALFNFYNDILAYDSAQSDNYDSKEIYIKKVSRYFDSVPEKTTAAELIRAVFEASTDEKRMGSSNPTIVLGYVKPGDEIVLFGGKLSNVEVELTKDDKLILFAAH